MADDTSSVLTLFAPSFSTVIHRSLASMADERLNGTAAQTTVHQIIQSKLGAGARLGDGLVAAWADSVKKMSKEQAKQVPDDNETAHFLQNPLNTGNGNWHFANLPAASSGYVAGAVGTDSHDVVHMLQEAIKSIKDGTDRFSKLNAIRLLVHLIGDIHQPLHVGCSYIRLNGNTVDLVVDPAEVSGLRDDTGGNDLHLTASKNLHSLWDGTLPADAQLADDLLDTDAPDPTMPTDDILQWPVLWATETIQLAAKAYSGITVTTATPQIHGNPKITIKLPTNYETNFKPIARHQAAVAARRVAFTLKTLFP